MKARTWIATLTGASLTLSTALLLAASTTSANADVTVGGSTGTPQKGQVILATNFDSAGNGYLFYVPSGTPAPTWTAPASGTLPTDAKILTQNLTTTTNNGCIMANPTAGTPSHLLDFTASGGNSSVVGYQPGSNGGSIGVSSKGGNATACTQVNQKERESLTIDLSPLASAVNTSAPVQAYAATLDVEAKGDAIITASLSYQGTATQTFTLYTGTSVKSGTLLPTEENCILAADSGPDSGSNDNCSWSIVPSSPFDKIVLTTAKPAGGAFSVEGGGDWSDPAAHETVFDVVTDAMGVLACGSSTPTVTDGATNPTTITVTRVANGSTTGCALIPYDLGASAGSGTFHKDLSTQLDSQFAVALTKTTAPSFGTYSGISATVVPNFGSTITVNWEDSNNTTSTLTYCPAGLYTGVDSSGNPTFDYTKVPGDLVSDSYLAGKQYACIFGETRKLNSNGSVTTTDLVYLTGDAKFAY
jgi:hypothetical protein